MASNIKTTSEDIYDALKRDIIERRIKPNEKIDVSTVLARFNVSRQPVASALNRLETEGFVVAMHRVGTFVKPVNRADLVEMLAYREMIEQWVAPIIINNLRNADLDHLRGILEGADALINTADSGDFQYQAVMSADQQFHEAMVQMCGNSRIIESYKALQSHLQIARVYTDDQLATCRAARTEHYRILDALAHRDVAAFQQAQQAHLNARRDHVLAVMDGLDAM